jgi:hypothetical protein
MLMISQLSQEQLNIKALKQQRMMEVKGSGE